MGVIKYDIKETLFDRTKSDQYELSILLGMDSFTYVVKEQRTNNLLAFRSLNMSASQLNDWVPQFQRCVHEDELLRPNLINKIYLSYLTNRATLVPSRLYTAGKETDYLGSLSDINLDDTCHGNAVVELGVHLVYALGEERLEATNRRFSPLKTTHVGSGLLRHWAQQSIKFGHRAVYCCVRDQHLIIAGLAGEKLQFFNIFPFGTASDALYFINLAYQQCGWSMSRIPLYLCGEVMQESEVYRQLYRFTEDIRFLAFDGSVEIGAQFQTIPQHLYYDLLCQF